MLAVLLQIIARLSWARFPCECTCVIQNCTSRHRCMPYSAVRAIGGELNRAVRKLWPGVLSGACIKISSILCPPQSRNRIQRFGNGVPWRKRFTRQNEAQTFGAGLRFVVITSKLNKYLKPFNYSSTYRRGRAREVELSEPCSRLETFP